jgi:hypothetical protein
MGYPISYNSLRRETQVTVSHSIYPMRDRPSAFLRMDCSSDNAFQSDLHRGAESKQKTRETVPLALGAGQTVPELGGVSSLS